MSANDLSNYNWPTDSDILSNKSLAVRIYFYSNRQKIKAMNETFIDYYDSAILNRLSDFQTVRCYAVYCQRYNTVCERWRHENNLATEWRH